MFETMLSGVIDEYPRLLRNKKVIVTAVTCLVEFILGLPLICQGGIYVLQVMDWYCASFSLMLISLTECVAISWFYGTERFYKDIELMIGRQPHFFWKYFWKFITPATILFIWLFSVSTLGPVTYGDKEYPKWAVYFGGFLAASSIIPIPLMIVIQVYNEDGPLIERFRKLVKPSPLWHPALEENKQRYFDSLGISNPESVQPALPVDTVNHDEKTPEHFALLSANEERV